MNVIPRFDVFRWQRGVYRLSNDEQLILRDLQAPLVQYAPDVDWIKRAMPMVDSDVPGLKIPDIKSIDGPAGMSRLLNCYTAEMVVQFIGFLTVPADADSEPVADWIAATGKLIQVHYQTPLLAYRSFVTHRPKEWATSMTLGGAISDELKMPDGRVLKGDEKKAYELAKASSEAWKRRYAVDPPSADELERRETELRSAYYSQHARINTIPSIDLSGKNPALELRPATLLDWTWFQLAGPAFGMTREYPCKQCGTMMRVDLSDKRRAKRIFCSLACNVKHDNASGRKKERAKKKAAKKK